MRKIIYQDPLFVVFDPGIASTLHKAIDNFGVFNFNLLKKHCLILMQEEAFYLHIFQNFSIMQGSEVLSYKNLMVLMMKLDSLFVYRFSVYLYFKVRPEQFVIKSGIKYGTDYVLYEEGNPETCHAKYCVLVKPLSHSICNSNAKIKLKPFTRDVKSLLHLNKNICLRTLAAHCRVSHSVGKQLILAFVMPYEPIFGAHIQHEPTLLKSFELDHLSSFQGIFENIDSTHKNTIFLTGKPIVSCWRKCKSLADLLTTNNIDNSFDISHANRQKSIQGSQNNLTKALISLCLKCSHVKWVNGSENILTNNYFTTFTSFIPVYKVHPIMCNRWDPCAHVN